MELENKTEEAQEIEVSKPPQNKNRFLGICIVIAALIIGLALVFTLRFKVSDNTLSNKAMAALEKIVIPEQGIILPVVWGDLGKQMVENGVIDMQKFESLYVNRQGLDESSRKLLTETNSGRLIITKENSGVLLNLLWGLGLTNKNEILERGPMVDEQYGGDPGRFASTGGWTLAVGNPMNHYSRHAMIPLTPEQQVLVETVGRNIYRPCCGNSTYFPDCNHGMAMLGLLELMASQGVSEAEMYKVALAVNSYWFPDTYLTIAKFLKSKNIEWNKTNAKDLLGANFSSASGYQQIKNQIIPVVPNSNNSCSN